VGIATQRDARVASLTATDLAAHDAHAILCEKDRRSNKMSGLPMLTNLDTYQFRFVLASINNSPYWQWLSQLRWHGGWTLGDTEATIAIITIVSAWITGIRMKRKIRKDLGRKATDADLTSIDTWMKVDEVEQRNKGNKE
jgi:hypothetical protein